MHPTEKATMISQAIATNGVKMSSCAGVIIHVRYLNCLMLFRDGFSQMNERHMFCLDRFRLCWRIFVGPFLVEGS